MHLITINAYSLSNTSLGSIQTTEPLKIAELILETDKDISYILVDDYKIKIVRNLLP